MDSLGTLQPGQSATIRRQGQPMSLNNGGDPITLVDPAEVAVQTVTYPSVSDGEQVAVP